MNKRIDSVWLLAENNMENPAIVTRQNLNNHYNMKEEDWYNRVYSGNGTPFILGVHEDSGSTSNEKIVSVARSIVSPTDGSFLGMFVINIKANDFAALWYNGQADDRIIAVADKENHLIMNPNAAKEDDLETYIQSVDAKMPVNKRQTVKLGNEKYYLVITQLECIEGKIYQFYATKSATKGFGILYFVLLIGTLLIGAVFYLISYRISDKITKPLYQLVDSMREVSGGNFQIQTDKLNGELQILSTTFNKMTKRIDIMFQELTEKEKQKRDMELLALQAQINPHFLYNTLNSIQCVAEMQGAENVSNMLDAMISILHYTAESAGEIVAMEKELTFIQNYIKIINFRYFDRFSFLVQADDKVRNYGTLRFILQPIVENAIFHGFEAVDLNALIEIKIVEKDQNLVIEITDNGRGMEEAKCAEILQHDSTERRGLNRIGMPYIISSVAVSIFFMYFFVKGGLGTRLFMLFGAEDTTWFTNKNYALFFVAIIYIWQQLGFYMILYIGGLQNISEEIYEAAKIDGASRLQSVLHITVPLVKPTTYMVITLGMINAFQIFDQIAAISKNGPLGSPAGSTSTVVTFLYQQSFSYMDMGYGSAAAMVLVVIIFVLSLVRNFVSKDGN